MRGMQRIILLAGLPILMGCGLLPCSRPRCCPAWCETAVYEDSCCPEAMVCDPSCHIKWVPEQCIKTSPCVSTVTPTASPTEPNLLLEETISGSPGKRRTNDQLFNILRTAVRSTNLKLWRICLEKHGTPKAFTYNDNKRYNIETFSEGDNVIVRMECYWPSAVADGEDARARQLLSEIVQKVKDNL